MAWVEIILLIIGICAFAASFLIPVSGEQLSREERKHTDAEIKARVDKHMEAAASKLNQSVDDAVQYAVEKTERSLERLSNEKIMGVSEYADTVLSDIHKNHEEVVFLYDMLNDKQTALKNAVTEVEKTAKAASTLSQEAKAAADRAVQNANEAALSADEAAKIAADAAESTDETSQIVQEALENANEAMLSAEEAVRRAQEAALSADTAAQTAGEAALRADAATQTAGAASQVANEAILTADRARQRAGEAMKNAKEVQRMNGIVEAEEPQPRKTAKTAMDSQNLSGLARVQGIQEAEAEAERLAAQEEAERALEAQAKEAQKALAAQEEAQKALTAQEEAERILEAQAKEAQRALAAQTEAERALSARAEAGRAPAVQDAGTSAMENSQRSAPGETNHFQPFVVPRITIIGEPADDAWEKEAPRAARTRAASGSRRGAAKKAAASENRTRTEGVSQKENGSGSRANVPEERNNNEKILAMHREGKSNIAIAKELGIGVGEVKLVIDLFRR